MGLLLGSPPRVQRVARGAIHLFMTLAELRDQMRTSREELDAFLNLPPGTVEACERGAEQPKALRDWVAVVGHPVVQRVGIVHGVRKWWER